MEKNRKDVKCSYHQGKCTGYFVGEHIMKCRRRCTWNEGIPEGQRINNWPLLMQGEPNGTPSHVSSVVKP